MREETQGQLSDLIDNEKIESFAAYAERHSLFEFFENLLKKVVISKPVDPFQFMIDVIQKPSVPSIIILGPPSSGHRTLVENVTRAYDAVLLSAGNLIQTAVEKQTAIGIQAKSYLDNGQLVPDDIMISMIVARLNDPDVREKGYILEGFPRTNGQAVSLLRRGIIPQHVIVLDFPDSFIFNRIQGLRFDPATGRVYHLKHDPPPRNALVESRLTLRPADSQEAVQMRVEKYRKNLDRILAHFKTNIRRFYYPNGIYGNEETIYNDIYSFIATRLPSKAPHAFKIVVQGLPGSGKTRVSEFIANKYGLVHVSPKKIILEEISAGSHWGPLLQEFVTKPEEAPEAYMLDLISVRLKKKDCVERGWVLEGFPNTKVQADALKSKGIVPTRCLWLNAKWETCVSRLTKRRYDIVSGRATNLDGPAKDIPDNVDEWMSRPEDDVNVVKRRMERLRTLRSEMEKAFQFRHKEDSTGIMQVVDADGIGENTGFGESSPIDTVFERIEGNLLRPIPIDSRIDL